jgi:hypothetical protein
MGKQYGAALRETVTAFLARTEANLLPGSVVGAGSQCLLISTSRRKKAALPYKSV